MSTSHALAANDDNGKPGANPAHALASHSRVRRLPDQWTHRTPSGVTYGPLAAVSGAPPEPLEPNSDAANIAVRQSPLQVLWVLTRTEFRARYRAQALGLVWSMLNPLVMMGIISIIFTQVFRSAEKNFPIFLLIGLLVWQWFSASITTVTNVFVSNADIIKRTIFPRPLLPIASILSFTINFSIESLTLLLFIPIFPDAFTLSPVLLLVPVLLMLALCLMFGIALALSVLNVIYRDVGYLVTTALLILYWLTPVFYPLEVITYPYRIILQCNPLAGILHGLRQAIMHGQLPTLMGWAGMLIPTAIIMIIGWRVFRHYEHMVLDYV